MALNRRKLLELLCCAGQPYTPVKYIVSNGQMIIDTGINPDDTTVVEYYGRFSNTAEVAYMGAGSNAYSPITKNRFYFYSHTANNIYY